MFGVNFGGPAGMVDGNVQEEARATRVHGIHQLAELLQRCDLGVELGQSRIHVHEIERGIRTAE